jgi:hypothetical protein
LHQSRLLALLSIQYAVPALVYFGIALVLRQTISMEDGRWFVQNYIYMAAPHILLGFAAGAFTRFRKHLVPNLFVANVALILFACWLVTQVPSHETGLAWILYLPLACLALALAFVVRFFHARIPQSSRAGRQ